MNIEPKFDLVVHATHEAGVKVGGIGAVLDGLLSARAYIEQVARTILVGPMDVGNRIEMARLAASSIKFEIDYSSWHHIDRLAARLSERLRAIERQYNVHILYGARRFGDARHEVILVDGRQAEPAQVNAYKAQLYERFGIQSHRYEYNAEYNTYINAAEPAFAALEAIAGECGARRRIIAHEFMGLPLCYSVMLHAPGAYGVIFYGHEVATVRAIIEAHPGHDTMFYNVLSRAQQAGRYLEDVFGDQAFFFKHGLIRPVAAHCDHILAVGDRVVQEMRFLGPDWAQAEIDLVYNGVPNAKITLQEKRASKAKLTQYCFNLLGYRPDYVFTHVTRFVPSKGLWRDLRVIEQLDELLAARRARAVLFVLSSVIPIGRPARAIFAMETEYGWPVVHREGTMRVDGVDAPDLVAHEIPFYRAIEQFNRTARAIQIVLINQFGWSRDRCGERMPGNMHFADIRRGTDVEFGQSVYEPFGIAQLEPLSFGALCVVSNVCGCVGFVDRVSGAQDERANVIVADYVEAGDLEPGVDAALAIDRARRDQIETAQAAAVAQQIIERLPQDEAAAQKLLQAGYMLSQKMSWQVVARDYLLPGLR